jgi:hypothetical protein
MVIDMTGSIKRKTLVILGLVMVITVIIAASLPQLKLQPGMPLPELENNQVVVGAAGGEPYESIAINRFVMYVFVLFSVVLFLHVLYKLLRGADWKNIRATLRPILSISLIIIFTMFLIMLLPKTPATASEELILPTPAPIVRSPLGPVPPILLWIVGLSLLGIGTLIGIWIFRSTSDQFTTIDLVGLEAEKAWQELKIGVGLKDVIIKCYRQMSLALEKEQGIERKNFMTTGEFEKYLESEGVPREPIQQLTRLFEAARYSDWHPNSADEQNAINSLKAIIAYSRQAKEMD